MRFSSSLRDRYAAILKAEFANPLPLVGEKSRNRTDSKGDRP